VRLGISRDVNALRICRHASKVNIYSTHYMMTFSSTIDANSFQANDLLEKGERRSAR